MTFRISSSNLVVAGLIAWAMVVSPPALAQNAPGAVANTGTITVSGYGEANAKPDEASLTFAVVGQGDTAKAAVDETSDAMSAVLAGMRELGAEDRDLQTANFQIFPRYGDNDQTRPGNDRSNEIVGYEARNSLSVTVRDVAEVGIYLDKAIELGINQGGDVRFAIADDESLLSEARTRAVENARTKAEQFAGAAGVDLGPIMSISEPSNDMSRPPAPMMRMAAAESASSVPIEAGELSRSASVLMVFELRSPDQR